MEKIREAIRHAAAEFLAQESNRTSLITVTGVHLSPRRDKATILVTIFPEDKEREALEFVARTGGALRDFLGKRVFLQRLPYISFALDVGEKNRQKIDELSS
ncbi:MAG: Ribosome-binding factor A [Parcubacteria group bacterium GW2011_GWA2_47_64]|nr:MAG: Ribosome-binding factor A [Parcubacteria group bacterium GW2011_GWA2_47_64]KKU96178.1 MAG: Ribosome-binding factor A [Parcubacteria group bacterium GW2011_GWC2_48_17]